MYSGLALSLHHGVCAVCAVVCVCVCVSYHLKAWYFFYLTPSCFYSSRLRFWSALFRLWKCFLPVPGSGFSGLLCPSLMQCFFYFSFNEQTSYLFVPAQKHVLRQPEIRFGGNSEVGITCIWSPARAHQACRVTIGKKNMYCNTTKHTGSMLDSEF